MVYKVYPNSTKATLANSFIRMIGFFPFIFAILSGIEGEYNWILIGGTGIFMLFINRVADRCADKIAGKAQSKIVIKNFDLFQTKTNEQGEEVLDIPEEILYIPATITLSRDKSFSGCLSKFSYVVNDTEIYKLGNDSSVEFTTTKPVNTITLKQTQGDFNDPSLVKFTVKSGENVRVSYQARDLSNFTR